MRRAVSFVGHVRRVVAAIALCAASVRTAAAQEVRGTVRDSASRIPLPGVVVLLLRDDGTTITRTLTNSNGAYRVPRGADARRVQARRIGFRPRVVVLPNASGDAQIDVAMARIPDLLEPVRVADASRCPRRSDRAAALGLWEQARSALLAAVVARDATPSRVVRLRYDRWMKDDSIDVQRVTIDSTDRSTRPFAAARTTDEFLRGGFVQASPGPDARPATFFAPDADVLLDERFASAYCFRLAGPDRARPREVGVAMTPATRAEGRVDIEGTLWIDTAARSLGAVTFRYVGPPAVERPERGGRVEFRTLDNGVPLIERWSMRLAELRADTTFDRGGSPRVREWHDMRQIGGELADLAWPDAFRWRAALGTLRLRGVRRDGAPAAGATVRLMGSNYTTALDSAGGGFLEYLLPGPYSVGVVEPKLEPLDMTIPTPARFVVERDSTVYATIQVPTLREYVAQLCLAEGATRVKNVLGGSAWLLARVVAADGRSTEDVRYGVDNPDWKKNASRPAHPRELGRLGSNGVLPMCRDLQLGSTYDLYLWRTGERPFVTRLTMKDSVNVAVVPIGSP